MKIVYFIVAVLVLYVVTSIPGLDSGIIKLAGLFLVALVTASWLQPSVAGIWTEKRWPLRREALLIFAAFLIAACSVWVIDAAGYFFSDISRDFRESGNPGRRAVVAQLQRLLPIVVVIVALIPAARLVLNANRGNKGAPQAIWPALLSIFAVLPILLGGYFLLNTADNRGVSATVLFLNVVLAFPPTLLLVAFGFSLWWQAFWAAPDARFTLAGVFPRLAAAGIMIWLVTMVAAPAWLYLLPGPRDTGQIIGVCVMIGLGAAWLWLLRSVADLEAVGLATLSSAAFGLSIAFGISSLLARGLSESSHTTIGDAAELILLFTLPVIGIVVAGIVFVVPRLLALLLTRPEAPPNPAKAR